MAKRILWVLVLGAVFGRPVLQSQPANDRKSLAGLLPKVEGWQLAEAPRTFLPSSLFEYINGAAESYLAYAFEELIVADYSRQSPASMLTLEIYEMGTSENAFGIYSQERSPESEFLSIGGEGYYETGSLNFIAGSKYIKILCPDCGAEDKPALLRFGRSIEENLPGRDLPRPLRFFPRDHLIARSERYIRQNVFGFSFLENAYIASYEVEGRTLDLFLIEAGDEDKAGTMLRRYLESQKDNGEVPDAEALGFHWRDRYMKNVFVTQEGRFLLGVTRVDDGFEDLGRKYLTWLVERVRGAETSTGERSAAIREAGVPRGTPSAFSPRCPERRLPDARPRL